MSGARKNLLLVAAVLLLTAFPLLTVKPPVGPNGEAAPIFTGADSQATGIIQQIRPDYRPWFDSLFKPPSGEIEGFLFTLQAAIGAGVIGYYVGYMRGRKQAAPPAPESSDRAH